MICKKTVFLSFLTGIILSLSSCTTDITIQIIPDGSSKINLMSKAESAISKMIPNFNIKNISEDLKKSGFSDIKLSQKQNSSTPELQLEMTEKNKKTYLYTSGLLKSDTENTVSLCITPKTLVDFYNSADSQTVSYLDLFLAPIFNNEIMSQEEYLDMLASVYGQNVANEIKDSYINITIKNQNKKTQSIRISIPELMTLQNSIQINF